MKIVSTFARLMVDGNGCPGNGKALLRKKVAVYMVSLLRIKLYLLAVSGGLILVTIGGARPSTWRWEVPKKLLLIHQDVKVVRPYGNRAWYVDPLD